MGNLLRLPGDAWVRGVLFITWCRDQDRSSHGFILADIHFIPDMARVMNCLWDARVRVVDEMEVRRALASNGRCEVHVSEIELI